jgi:3-keto-5-aminohexanoate cleavage enzyme
VRCYEAGAAVVHIHMRTKDGKSTEDPSEMGPMVEGIRKRCPILINLSTAVGYGKTPEQRISVVKNFAPELASLNSGSMNFGRANWKTGEIQFGFVFENTFKMIKEFNEEMKKAGTKPEFEVYDIGHVDTIMLMRKSGIFQEPLHFQFVFGVAGGIRLTASSFALFMERIPDDATWSACGVGPNSFRAAFMAAANGGHIRVGLEDNLYISGKTLAKGNFELVEKAVQIARLADREPATPEEAREILKIGVRA